MAAKHFTVRLPEHLHRRAQEELPPDVSLSALLAEKLREKLAEAGECAHDVLRCERCGARVERTQEPPEDDEVEELPGGPAAIQQVEPAAE